MNETESLPARTRLGLGAAVVLVILALAVTIVVGVFRSLGNTAEVLPSPTASSAIQPGALYVHLAGAVNTPGLYRLAHGARVVDGIAAAGGLTPDADSSAINLARPLSDGEQLIVPMRGQLPATGMGTSGSVSAADGKINLNTADVDALDTLPRIGPAIAQRIIEWRTQNGRFTSIDDLLSVPGIGEKLLDGIRDRVTL